MTESLNFDSKEEYYFSLWLSELLPTRLITSETYQPHSFSLSDKVTMSFELQMTTKTRQKDYHVFADHGYRADWIIHWSEKAWNILIPGKDPLTKSPLEFPFFAQWSEKKNSFFSVIDIKGSFSGPHNNSAVTFPLNQKWVYQKYGIYVQKLILIPRITKKGKQVPSDALFPTTFMPRRLTTTDNSGKDRKINYKYIFMEEYLQNNGLR